MSSAPGQAATAPASETPTGPAPSSTSPSPPTVAHAASAASAASAAPPAKQPLVVLVSGMAGSGKSTFVSQLSSHLKKTRKAGYTINLDPAVQYLPFDINIDIRDTVNYKEVMKQYTLGPNGAILTALNLFTTKFDQVLQLVDKRAPELDYIVIDTPGQIEIFTWSASGTIITDTLAATHPTVICYVIDTPRSASPATFMSNMLYACSILYKTKLPFVLVWNKTDIKDHQFAVEWMRDFEAFQAALADDTTYMATLVNSMCMVLDEFYQHLSVVGVSSVTGTGMDALMDALAEARGRYDADYLPELERALKRKQAQEAKRQQGSLTKLMADMALDPAAAATAATTTSTTTTTDASQASATSEADRGHDGGMDGADGGDDTPFNPLHEDRRTRERDNDRLAQDRAEEASFSRFLGKSAS